MFWFSLPLLLETFLILTRILLDIVTNLRRSSCKVFIILVRFAKNTELTNVMKFVQWEPSCSMRADRQTEANSRFSQNCEVRLWKSKSFAGNKFLILRKPNDTPINSLCRSVQPVSRFVNPATVEFCLVNKLQGQLCTPQLRAQMRNATSIQAAHSTGLHLSTIVETTAAVSALWRH
jgi:hypothetical protein